MEPKGASRNITVILRVREKEINLFCYNVDRSYDRLIDECQIKHTQRIDDCKSLGLGNKLYLVYFIKILIIGNHKTEAINSI